MNLDELKLELDEKTPDSLLLEDLRDRIGILMTHCMQEVAERIRLGERIKILEDNMTKGIFAELKPLKLYDPVSPHDENLIREEIKKRRKRGESGGTITFTEYLNMLELIARLRSNQR